MSSPTATQNVGEEQATEFNLTLDLVASPVGNGVMRQRSGPPGRVEVKISPMVSVATHKAVDGQVNEERYRGSPAGVVSENAGTGNDHVTEVGIVKGVVGVVVTGAVTGGAVDDGAPLAGVPPRPGAAAVEVPPLAEGVRRDGVVDTTRVVTMRTAKARALAIHHRRRGPGAE